MSFRTLCVFAAFMFALAAANAPHAEACDTGGQVGQPTFSLVQPQVQAYVAAPVVTQQFVQRHVVAQQFVAAPVQQYAAQVVQPVVLQQNVVRAPRRQVTRQVTTQRTGGLLFGR